MRNFAMFCLLLICLIGCKTKNSKKFVLPDPKEMAIILADIHLAESTLSDNSSTISPENHPGGFNFILKKHGLDKTQFDSAVAFYTTQPAVYQSVYEDVLAILTEREMSARASKDDSVTISIHKNQPIASASPKSLWNGARVIMINSQDSTRLKANFVIKVDSIQGGSLELSAKYRFKTKESIKIMHKMCVFVTYSDGARDSSEINVINTSVFKNFSTQIRLSQQQVKNISGNLITYTLQNPLIVEINDIKLDWTPTISIIEKGKE